MTRTNNKCYVSLSPKREGFSKQGMLPRELDDELAEAMGATRRAELELEMADTDVKVGTNAGNVNVPEHCAEDPEATLTALVTTVDVEELGGAALAAGEGDSLESTR